MDKELNIFFEDPHILVCEKPPGVPSQSDRSGGYDMVNRIKNYLYQHGPKTGEPYGAIVHRLDRPVGGVMVFAKNKKAAGGLSRDIQGGRVKKYYLALVRHDGEESPEGKPVKLTDYLVKDGRTNLSRVTGEGDSNGKKAELYYRVMASKDGLSLMEIELLTGRHHQIRVQMAEHFGGIYGDTKYNPLFQDKKGWNRIGLYAYCLEFAHPVTGKPMRIKHYPDAEPFTIFKEFYE